MSWMLMPNTTPAVIEVDPDMIAKRRFRHTGWDTITEEIISIPTHSAGTLSDNMFALPSTRTDFGKIAEIEAADPTTFLMTSETKDIRYMDLVYELVSQARTIVQSIGHDGAFPSMTNRTCAIYSVFNCVKDGLMKRKPTATKADQATARTSLTEEMQGWDGYVNPGTAESWPISKFRIFGYEFGLAFAENFPKLGAKLESSNATNIDRLVLIYTCMSIFVQAYLIHIGADQSDRCTIVLGALMKAINRQLLPDDMIKDVFDEIWQLYMTRAKYDYSVKKSVTGYHQVSGDSFVDMELLFTSTLQASRLKYEHSWPVPSSALVLARQMFGIGKVEHNGETEHWMRLLNLACHAGNNTGGPLTGYDYHGFNTTSTGTKGTTVKWFAGLNLYITQKFYEDMEGIVDEWRLMLKEQKHWTYKDLISWGADMWVDYNVVKSLHGTINPSAIKASKRLWKFASHDDDTGWLFAADVNSCVDMLDAGSYQYNTNKGTLLPLFLTQLGDLEITDWVYYPFPTTDEEVLFQLRLESLFICDGDISVLKKGTKQEYYSLVRRRSVPWVNAQDKETLALFTAKGTGTPSADTIVETIRFGSISNHVGSSYASESSKHALQVVSTDPNVVEAWTDARIPSHWHQVPPSKIIRIGDPDVQRTWLSRVVPVSKEGSSSKMTPEPDQNTNTSEIEDE